MINAARVSESGGLPRVRKTVKAITNFFRRKPLGAVGGSIIFTMALVAIFAPLVTFYEPTRTSFGNSLLSPQWNTGWGPTPGGGTYGLA